jgi:glycosyltransferase involved in cell wall biosynthesis
MIERRTDILIWVAGKLDKRGSFEDYLLRLARGLNMAGLGAHLVAGPPWDAGLRRDLAALGLGLTELGEGQLRSPLRAAGILARTRPRLLHYHFGSPSSKLAGMAALAGVQRFVFTDHGSRSQVEPAGAGVSLASGKRLLRRMRSRLVDLYLPVSQEVAGHLRQEIGLPAAKLRPLMNGVDLARFRPATPAERGPLRRRLLGLQGSEPVLLYAGQLTPEKGVEDLLAVQPALLAAFPELRIAWAGDGPLRAAVEAASGPRVQVLGRRGDMPELLRGADLVVAPSRWREAFSLILAEAAASGLPAVAARIGGIPEVVANQVTGELVPPGDQAALLASLSGLIAEPTRRIAMGQAARRRAEALFDLDAMIAATLRHYAALLPNPIPSLTPSLEYRS